MMRIPRHLHADPYAGLVDMHFKDPKDVVIVEKKRNRMFSADASKRGAAKANAGKTRKA